MVRVRTEDTRVPDTLQPSPSVISCASPLLAPWATLANVGPLYTLFRGDLKIVSLYRKRTGVGGGRYVTVRGCEAPD